jgi:hypothetical protein
MSGLERLFSRLVSENAELREALEREWLAAHSDHCDRWPHEGECHWPRPALLDSSVLSENEDAPRLLNDLADIHGPLPKREDAG